MHGRNCGVWQAEAGRKTYFEEALPAGLCVPSAPNFTARRPSRNFPPGPRGAARQLGRSRSARAGPASPEPRTEPARVPCPRRPPGMPSTAALAAGAQGSAPRRGERSRSCPLLVLQGSAPWPRGPVPRTGSHTALLPSGVGCSPAGFLSRGLQPVESSDCLPLYSLNADYGRLCLHCQAARLQVLSGRPSCAHPPPLSSLALGRCPGGRAANVGPGTPLTFAQALLPNSPTRCWPPMAPCHS